MSDNPEHACTPESWLSRHAPYLLLLAYLYYGTQIAIQIFDDRFDFHGVLLLVPNAIIVLLAFAGVGVVVRVAARVFQGDSGTRILRVMLGEPTWWRTWYPRMLRAPGSVWDRLPLSLKVMRTVIWLELLLLPAGFVLTVFVTPTFRVVFEIVGLGFPVIMGMFESAVVVVGWILPVAALSALVQGRRWRVGLGLPRMVAFRAFFSVSPEFWRDTDARRLLGD